jgi:hypothetical protein
MATGGTNNFKMTSGVSGLRPLGVSELLPVWAGWPMAESNTLKAYLLNQSADISQPSLMRWLWDSPDQGHTGMIGYQVTAACSCPLRCRQDA